MAARRSVLLPVGEARSLALDALLAAGASAAAAAATAAATVAAQIDGKPGHGLMRIPLYAAQIASGKIDGQARPAVAHAAPSLLRADAATGLFYPAFEAVIQPLADLARQQGVASAVFVNSHHFGCAGLHVERLAEMGFIALLTGNTPAAMAAWGASKPLLGTNPIAFAAPAAGRTPLVIDLALSASARGPIMLAAREGRAIPEGWALDAKGKPTTDPAEALAGSLLPSGGAKGIALALAVEVLATALTGMSASFQASSLFDDRGPPPRLGQLLLAFSPAAASGDDSCAARTAAILRAYAASGDVRIPGDRRLELRRVALEEGVAVDAALASELRAAACQAG